MKTQVYVLVIILFFINMFFIIYSHFSLHNKYNEYKPMVYNFSQLKSDLSFAHLWTEEYIIGDKSIDLEKDIYSKLEDKSLISFFKEIKNITNDEQIIKKIKTIKVLYNKLYEATKNRIESANSNLAGSDTDQLYDKQFNKLYSQVEDTIKYINQKEDQELKNNNLFFYIVIILFIIFNLIIFLIVRKFYKKDINSNRLIYQQMKLVSMGEMISNIAHQWRQPLNLISTVASSTRFKFNYEDVDKEYIDNNLNTIIKQTKYLSQTIDNFRNYIKNDNVYTSTSIKDVVEKTLSIVESSLKSSYILIEQELKDDMEIDANENELVEALINLINNSKDALIENNIENKLLFIKGKKIDENIYELNVFDNAGGIDESILPRVFEPYFTTKHQTMGTGLGLSMVDKIIKERLYGSIDVKNKVFIYDKQEYKGACFRIIFKR